MEHTGFQGKEYCFKGDEIFEQVKQSNYLSTSKGRSRHHSHVLILKYQHWERKKSLVSLRGQPGSRTEEVSL